MADPRIARIEQGIAESRRLTPWAPLPLADLRTWQEIAERHPEGHWCVGNVRSTYWAEDPCPDRRLADSALDRLDALWGTAASADSVTTEP